MHTDRLFTLVLKIICKKMALQIKKSVTQDNIINSCGRPGHECQMIIGDQITKIHEVA